MELLSVIAITGVVVGIAIMWIACLLDSFDFHRTSTVVFVVGAGCAVIPLIVLLTHVLKEAWRVALT